MGIKQEIKKLMFKVGENQDKMVIVISVLVAIIILVAIFVANINVREVYPGPINKDLYQDVKIINPNGN